MSLCDGLVIPEHCGCFYKGLNTNTTMKDMLPEPDILEDEDSIVKLCLSIGNSEQFKTLTVFTMFTILT